jgi:hypothetical protein
LWSHLKALIPFWEGSGLPRGLAGFEGAPTLVEGSPVWVNAQTDPNNFGRALDMEGFQGVSYNSLGISGNVTFGTICTPYGALLDGGSLFGHYQSSAREAIADVDWAIMHDGSNYRARCAVGGSAFVVDSTSAGTTQQRSAIFGVRDGDNLHIYIDGVKEATTTGLGAGATDTDHSLYLGADSTSAFNLATAGIDAAFEIVYVFDIALPSNVIRYLSLVDPFAGIRPPLSPLSVAVAAGSSSNPLPILTHHYE